MKKKSILIAISVILLGLLAIPYNIAQNLGYFRPVFKITNPSNPLFNPGWFNFTDYPIGFAGSGNKEKSVEYMRQLFPVGMSKEEVEKILIDAGKAEPRQDNELPNVWLYVKPYGFLSRGHNTVIYDEDQKLVNYFFQPIWLYEDQITTKDLRELKQEE